MMYGKGNPTLDSIVKLAQFFKIPVVELLREDAERTQPTAQEPLALYHADGPTNRLLSAFAQLTTADQEEFVLAMEQRAAKNAEILRELTSRGSPAAAAFKPALPDREVERRLKLHEKPR